MTRYPRSDRHPHVEWDGQDGYAAPCYFNPGRQITQLRMHPSLRQGPGRDREHPCVIRDGCQVSSSTGACACWVTAGAPFRRPSVKVPITSAPRTRSSSQKYSPRRVPNGPLTDACDCPGLTHESYVFFPDFLWPLLRVVDSAVIHKVSLSLGTVAEVTLRGRLGPGQYIWNKVPIIGIFTPVHRLLPERRGGKLFQ